jgi:hypothetical protein
VYAAGSKELIVTERFAKKGSPLNDFTIKVMAKHHF